MSSPDPQARISAPGSNTGVHARSRPQDDALRRTIEADLIPRLALSHRAGLFPPNLVALAGRVLESEDVEEFVRVVRGISEAGLDGYIEDLLDEGTTPEAIYLELMAPAARRMGELWMEDSCSFMEVSLALGRMQRVLRALEGRFLATGPGEGIDARRILLTALPGEQHTLGLILVAEFFLRDGWAVDVGTPFGGSDPVSRLSESWYHVAGFSAASDDRLDRLQKEIRRARQLSRNRDLVVLVGGPPFVDRPDLARRVGADGTAGDARQAPIVAAEGLR